MRTAVVTITHGRDAHLLRQRAALAEQLRPPDLHVVVRMGEEPSTVEVDGLPPVTTVGVPVSGAGLPLAAARNAGAAAALAAGAELLVLLDVDCIPAPRMLARYVDAAARTPDPALLCGPVHYLPPPPPGGYPTTGLAALAPPHPARPAPPDGTVLADDRFTLFWSLSFAATAATWAAAGGFCEDYTGYGGEDTDFAHVARGRGVTLHWVGGAVAFHQHHPPARDSPARVAEIVRNAHLFHRRHGWWPMTGWLGALAASGDVEFDPARGLLRLVDPAARLAAERTSTAGRVAALAAQVAALAEQQALTTHDDEHDPEGVTIAFERAQLLGLLAGARRDLDAIGRAEQRLAADTYGHCLRCGGPIHADRLEALPAGETCLACASHRR